MKMTTHVKKWGNSLAIRIPQAVAEDLGLSSDSPVQLISNGKNVVLKPSRLEDFTLRSMLAGVTPQNVQLAEDWGEDVGAERIDV